MSVDTDLTYDMIYTRAQHVAWAKERALRELWQPGLSLGQAIASALAAMVSDLSKHPETADHPGNYLGVCLIAAGLIHTRDEMQKHIEGYN